MSRTYDALRSDEAARRRLRSDWERGPRKFHVLTVTSNKGGVGKTTVATNLAIYLRALREDLPILLIGLDDQPMLERMFAIDEAASGESLLTALRRGNLSFAIQMGQYGVNYIPSSPDIAELKREIEDCFQLQRVLQRTDWSGLVIIDTKSDLEILTQNAIAASDLALVIVSDHASLLEAQKVFDLLEEWYLPRDRARILLSLVDLRIKYDGENRDVLALLLAEIRRRGWPLFETFISRSPKIESLYTNPEKRAVSILHGAPRSLIHNQMHHLAQDVLSAMDGARPPIGAEVQAAIPPPEPAPLATNPLRRLMFRDDAANPGWPQERDQ